ncbi:hypothetical protein ACQB60_07280 [Actinomycetota bacterium Odt1-20B]
MTDHTGRASLEQHELYAVAREFEKLRGEITLSYTPDSLPDLVTSCTHLATLTGLVKDLSIEVLTRTVDTDPGIDLGRVIYGYATASVPAGRAMSAYTEAFEQLGFLRRYTNAPDSPDLNDARQAASRVVQDRLDHVVKELRETTDSLRGSADLIDGTPPRILAALSRSARPRNSIYRLPEEPATPAQTPGRLAYTPAPRHAH